MRRTRINDVDLAAGISREQATRERGVVNFRLGPRVRDAGGAPSRSSEVMSERLAVSRSTYVRVEKGNPKVSLGIYAGLDVAEAAYGSRRATGTSTCGSVVGLRISPARRVVTFA